ncbi:hypothetical protein [Kitasatospora fiedleri]|uniref:hypothetical protein n=1 Tax=Kitasatospora fiedleri TaxID=2991545 RepID=UPI00249A3077|nr:hypothetical protein [Kitasatospora fiedleri]
MRSRIFSGLAVLAAIALTGPVLAVGQAQAAPAAGTVEASAPAGFVGMAPTRVLDTRNSYWNASGVDGPLSPGENYRAQLLDVAGRAHGQGVPVVPSDATAVVVNVTVADATDNGYLTLSADPNAPGVTPATSSINFAPRQTVANLVTVAITPGTVPAINVYNNGSYTHVVLDVVGYYRPGATDKYGAVTPTRLLDSRADGHRIEQGGVRSVQVAKPELGTADARAVILNVTATDGTGDTFLTVYPSGGQRPEWGSNLNVKPGGTVPNQVVVPVGQDGKVDVFNHIGSQNVVVDIVGFYGPSGQGLFSALKVPVRLADTRPNLYEGRPSQQLAPFSTLQVPTGAGAPAGALAAEVNVTATGPSESGHFTVFPSNTTRPDTSNLNFVPRQTVSNSVTTGLNGDSFSVYNHAGWTHAIADLTGYFTVAK